MQHIEVVKLSQNKGAPRIWVQGRKARIAGFNIGARYATKVDPESALLTLELSADGTHVVSKKRERDKEVPVIDLNSQKLLSMFEGLQSVRLVIQGGKISILPVASEVRARRRLSRLRERVRANETLSVASAATGIGILDLAAHEAMESEGLKTRLGVAVEIRDDCMEHAVEVNPAFTDSTTTVTMPMQEFAFDHWAVKQVGEHDIFTIGMPCSGASVAGKAKLGLSHAESHPEVGHMVVAFLALVARLNPAVIALECVVPYRSTASMELIRNMLRDLCYEVHEAELSAEQWNMLEHRVRFCMVAVSPGIRFSFDDVQKPVPAEVSFGQVMDNVDPEHSTWGRIDYIWSKLQKDQAAGKGFSPTVVDATSRRVPTLNKTLHKRQSTGTYIRHPADQDLFRIPTVREHARCKGVDERLVEGTTQTFGHEILGQSISVPPFRAVFAALARAIVAYANSAEEEVIPLLRVGGVSA